MDLWLRKIPWRKKWPPTPVFLPAESHVQRSQGGLQFMGSIELDTTERLTRHQELILFVPIQGLFLGSVPQVSVALKRYRFLNPALGMYDSTGLGSSPRAMLSSTSDSDHQLMVRTTLPSTHLSIFMQPEHSNIALSEPTLHFLA